MTTSGVTIITRVYYCNNHKTVLLSYSIVDRHKLCSCQERDRSSWLQTHSLTCYVASRSWKLHTGSWAECLLALSDSDHVCQLTCRGPRGPKNLTYVFINFGANNSKWLLISINYTENVMDLYAHAQTVDTRHSSPIFKAPGYKASKYMHSFQKKENPKGNSSK